MHKLTHLLLLTMGIPLNLLGLTFINNYKYDVTVTLFKNDRNDKSHRILKTTIKSGTMVTLRTNITATDQISIEIFCKKWIRKHAITGPMFFMRASANPEGTFNRYLGAEFNNNCALLLQRYPRYFGSFEDFVVISPDTLQNPIIQSRIKAAMNQDYSWRDKTIKGNDRKPINLTL